MLLMMMLTGADSADYHVADDDGGDDTGDYACDGGDGGYGIFVRPGTNNTIHPYCMLWWIGRRASRLG